MSDERIERELRTWLASEAGDIELPAGLRQRAASVPIAPAQAAPRRRFGFSLATASGAVGVVVIAALTLSLLGILQVGRADCSGVSFGRVRDAVDVVDGYSYRLEGTELISTLHFPIASAQPFDYEESRIEAEGAYRAPDRWRLEVMSGLQGDPPGSSNIQLFNMGIVQSDRFIVIEEFVVIGSAQWVRLQGMDRFITQDNIDPYLDVVGANELEPLLDGQIFDGTLPPLAFDWTVRAETSTCVMNGTLQRLASTGATWELTIEVDPATHLPMSVRQQVEIPESESSATSWAFTFTFDYENAPEIEPPVVAPK